jgi:hypothetical protein
MKKLTYAIMVLDDGETFSPAVDCELLILTEEGVNLLDSGESPRDLAEEHIIHTIKFDAYDD